MSRLTNWKPVMRVIKFIGSILFVIIVLPVVILTGGLLLVCGILFLVVVGFDFIYEKIKEKLTTISEKLPTYWLAVKAKFQWFRDIFAR